MKILFKKNVINEYFTNYDYIITFIKERKNNIDNHDENTNNNSSIIINKKKKKIKKILERLKYIYIEFIFNFDDTVNNLAVSIDNLLAQRNIYIDDIKITDYNNNTNILFNKLKINFENSDKSEESLEKPKNNFYTINFKKEKESIPEIFQYETNKKTSNKKSMQNTYNKISSESSKEKLFNTNDIYDENNTIQIIDEIINLKDKKQGMNNNNLNLYLNEKEELKIKTNNLKTTDYKNKNKNNINSHSTTLTKEKTISILSEIKEKNKDFSKKEKYENFIPLDFFIPIPSIYSNIKINEISENKKYKKLLGIKRKIDFNEE